MEDKYLALELFSKLEGALYIDSEKKETAFSNIESAKTFKQSFPEYKTYYKVEIK